MTNYDFFCIFAPNFNDLYEICTEIQRFSLDFAGCFALGSPPSVAFHLRQFRVTHAIRHHTHRCCVAGMDDETGEQVLRLPLNVKEARHLTHNTLVHIIDKRI